MLPTYWLILIGAIVWLPLGCMIVCYAAILWKLDRYETRMMRLRREQQQSVVSVSYKRRAAKTLFAVVLTFVVLRLPFTVMVFARYDLQQQSAGMNQVDGSFSVLWYTSHYLIFLHAAINPFIYGLTNVNFRNAYGRTPVFRVWTWCGGQLQADGDGGVQKNSNHNGNRRAVVATGVIGLPMASRPNIRTDVQKARQLAASGQQTQRN